MTTAQFLEAVAKLAQGAGGDVAFAVGLMVVLMVATVIVMPVALPWMLEGVSIGAWSIARSLVVLMLVPLAIALAVLAHWPDTAAEFQPVPAKTSTLAVILLVVVASVAAGVAVGARDPGTRAVVALGTGQRNLSAALVVATQSFAGTETANGLLAPVLRPVDGRSADDPAAEPIDAARCQLQHHPGVGNVVGDGMWRLEAESACRPEAVAGVIAGMPQHEHEIGIASAQGVETVRDQLATDALVLRFGHDGERRQQEDDRWGPFCLEVRSGEQDVPDRAIVPEGEQRHARCRSRVAEQMLHQFVDGLAVERSTLDGEYVGEIRRHGFAEHRLEGHQLFIFGVLGLKVCIPFPSGHMPVERMSPPRIRPTPNSIDHSDVAPVVPAPA